MKNKPSQDKKNTENSKAVPKRERTWEVNRWETWKKNHQDTPQRA